MLNENQTLLTMDKVASYRRKSREDKNKQVASLGEQEVEVKKIADARGLTIIQDFKEEKSGKISGVRKEFYTLLEKVKSGEINTIICWKADRLARNGSDGGQVIELVDNRKLKIITSDTTYTRENSMFLWLEFMSSTKLSKDISDNVIRNNESKLKNGIYPGKSPLGYRFDPNKLKGQKDHIPAYNHAQLREFIVMMLTGNYNVKQALELMTAKGLRGRKGQPVSYTSGHVFLKNIFNTGMFTYKGELYQGIHTPLLTLNEYHQLQKIITKGSQAKHDPLWFMNKLFTCRKCGTAISGYKRPKTYKNGKTATWYYTKHSSKVSCPEKSMTAEELNTEFKARVGSMKFTPRFIEWMRAAVKYQNKHQIQIVHKEHELLTKRLIQVRDDLNKVFDKKAEGYYTNRPELYEEDKAKYLKQEKLLQEEMQGDKTKFYRELMEDKVSFIERFERLAKSEHPGIKRRLAKILGSNLTIQDRHLMLDPKKSFIALQKIQYRVEQKLRMIEPKTMEDKNSVETQTPPLKDGVDDQYRVRESNP